MVNSFQLPADRCPRHVAIIMDGNGRWATKRGLPRIEGHRRGVEAAKNAVRALQKTNVEVTTLYAFSFENWNRPKKEVAALMKLLHHFLVSSLAELVENRIRFRVIGRYKELPEQVQDQLRKVESETAHFDQKTFALALNYGARMEIIDTIKTMLQAHQRGEIDIDRINYDQVSNYLYTAGLPDPDLIIRTSGEHRLSNFLLLQAAYAEIYFTPVLWPDFSDEDIYSALSSYASRERRYGKTAEQLQSTDQTLYSTNSIIQK